MVYNDKLQRSDWLSSSYLHKRIPALIHLINTNTAWSTGTLYNEATTQGYLMSYKTFQRDIELCEAMNLVSADLGLWKAGRSTIIAIKPNACALLMNVKLPSNATRKK